MSANIAVVDVAWTIIKPLFNDIENKGHRMQFFGNIGDFTESPPKVNNTDLLILDPHLQGDASKLVQELRQEYGFDGYIIVLTVGAMKSKIEQELDKTEIPVLKKPIHCSELIKEIEQVLGEKK